MARRTKKIPRESLIRRRERLGWKRPELARKLGINRFHLYNVETGARVASAELMARWSEVLGATIRIWPEQDRKRYYERLNDLTVGKTRRGGAALGA